MCRAVPGGRARARVKVKVKVKVKVRERVAERNATTATCVPRADRQRRAFYRTLSSPASSCVDLCRAAYIHLKTQRAP
jgi:hypothetical protein